MLMRRMKAFVGCLVICFATLGASEKASAETLQIAALGFVPHWFPGYPTNPGSASEGLLVNARGIHFASVIFPTSGKLVCRFRLIYRDYNFGYDISARLMRKSIAIGGGAFAPPVVMASVASSGADPVERRAVTSAIALSKINNLTAFYFVELVIEDNFNLEVLGVQIDVQTTCP
jgi:hypothetical protein